MEIGCVFGHDEAMHKFVSPIGFVAVFSMLAALPFTVQAQETAPVAQSAEALGGGARVYSEAEIRLLQELEVRRVELARREQALELREQLVDLMESQLAGKIENLTKLRDELKVLMGNISGKEDGELEQLARVYESMKPKIAATVLNKLDNFIVYDLFRKMTPKKTAKIMEALDPAKSRFISEMLAERIDLPAAPE